MEHHPLHTELSTEKRLVSTLIMKKPKDLATLVMVATVLIMAAFSQLYWSNLWGIAETMPAVHSSVFYKGEWWRVFTAIFIHADIGHFLSNMLFLAIFSYFIFGHFGMGLFPSVSVLGAAAVNALAIWTYPEETRLLGASGLVYVLGGLWLTLYYLIQRQYSHSGRILRVAGIGLMLFFPSTFAPTTSYRTHAIGFFVGIAIGLVYFVKNKKYIRSQESYKEILV